MSEQQNTGAAGAKKPAAAPTGPRKLASPIVQQLFQLNQQGKASQVAILVIQSGLPLDFMNDLVATTNQFGMPGYPAVFTKIYEEADAKNIEAKLATIQQQVQMIQYQAMMAMFAKMQAGTGAPADGAAQPQANAFMNPMMGMMGGMNPMAMMGMGGMGGMGMPGMFGGGFGTPGADPTAAGGDAAANPFGMGGMNPMMMGMMNPMMMGGMGMNPMMGMGMGGFGTPGFGS